MTVTDRSELRPLERYGGRGYYETMMKGSTVYYIRVWRGASGTGYYIHGDAVGSEPGGVVQTIFVPSEPGLTAYLRGLEEKHRGASAGPN